MERVQNANGARSKRKWSAFETRMERVRNANGTRSERKWNANAVLGNFFFQKIQYSSQNFNKKCAQNAGNRISEALDFKIFRRRIPPDPPTYARFWIYASVSPHAGSALDGLTTCCTIYNKMVQMLESKNVGQS